MAAGGKAANGGQSAGAADLGGPAGGDADDPRQMAHVLVALAQALLHIASQDQVVAHWWPGRVPDIRPSFQELALRAGEAHAQIASGIHDTGLAAVLGNGLGRPKVGLLRRHLVRIMDYVRGHAFEQAANWLEPACGIASSALGSMSFIPGVGVIQEGLDLIPAGLDTIKRLRKTDDKDLPDGPQPNGRT